MNLLSGSNSRGSKSFHTLLLSPSHRRNFTLLALIAVLPAVMLLASCANQESANQSTNTDEQAQLALSSATPSPPPSSPFYEGDAEGLPPIAPSHGSARGAFGGTNSASSSANAGWSLLDGRRMTLDEMRGNVVVLDFYATWCPPCRDEVPHLVKLERLYNKQGLRVVGLNVGGEEDMAQVPAFVDEFKIQYQLGTPDIPLVYDLMGDETAIPQTFVFNRQGKLLRRFVSYSEEIGEEIEQTVQAALREN